MTISLTRAAEGFPRRAFTVADIFRMIDAGIIAEDENFELVEGEIVPMNPKHDPHEAMKSALVEVLVAVKPARLRLGLESSIYLSDMTFLEPDFSLFDRKLTLGDVRGPDVELAIEIAASTLQYDRGLKARVYARYGVLELWVIDARTRVTWVHTGPQDDGTWASIVEKRPDEALTAEALPGAAIVLAALD